MRGLRWILCWWGRKKFTTFGVYSQWDGYCPRCLEHNWKEVQATETSAKVMCRECGTWLDVIKGGERSPNFAREITKPRT